jgi:hypothetical protein
MTLVASTVVSKVRTQLVDTGSPQRWTDAELLAYLSDAQRTIVAMVPSSASTHYILPLLAGTRQPIPANAHTLLSVTRNTDATGTVPGRAVRITQREQLDAAVPDWHTAAASTAVRNYTFDPSEKAFYVYPPNTGSGFVDIVYSQLPSELSSLSSTLVVHDNYQTALFDYAMFRAHQKDSDFSAGQQLAQGYLNSFSAFMGLIDERLLQNSPNTQLTPLNLTVDGAAK